jgi:hypothetical protein
MLEVNNKPVDKPARGGSEMGQSEVTVEVVGSDYSASLPPLADITSIAEKTLEQTVEYCAKKMKLSPPQLVLDCLHRGESHACDYFHYNLAKQVAEHLSQLDDSIRAVYLCNYDATPMDTYLSEEMHMPLVHLIVWTQRKTAALDAVVRALDQALVRHYAEMADTPHLQRILDVQVVEDPEVENRVGYGALLSSIHTPPLQVWKRP